MLTVKMAAVKAGVCPSIVYGWIDSGELAHYRLGSKGHHQGGIRIGEEDLAAFLATRRKEGRAGEAPAAPKRKPIKLANLTISH